MLIRTGLENNIEGRSMAWALEHPGLFAYGPDGEGALAAMPAALRQYKSWIQTHTSQSWLPEEWAEYHLEETFEGYVVNEQYERVAEGYEVNAWFLSDWRSLSAAEVERGLHILDWSRADLLETVSGLSAAVMERTYPKERWSIYGILNHVGGAEWWYLDRLSLAFPRSEVPQDAFERLAKVRQYLHQVLPGLAGVNQVVGIDGEFWSPRKLLRRAVWHELDHLEHIRKLI